MKKINIIILFLIFLLVSISELSILHNIYSDEMEERFSYDLELIADKKAAEINIFFESKVKQLEILANSATFINAIENPDNEGFIDAALDKIISLRDVTPGIGLVSLNGTVLAAEDFPLGFSYSSHPYFQMKKTEIYFDRYYDPSRKGDYFGVIFPMHSESKEIMGFLFLDIPFYEINDIMREDIEDNFTEVYMVDRERLLLTESRFIGGNDRKGILLQEVKSDSVIDCIEDMGEYGEKVYTEEHEEEISQYTNYMGEEVIGTHSYAKRLGGCIIAESNVEKMHSYATKEIVYLITSLFPIIIFLGMLIFIFSKRKKNVK